MTTHKHTDVSETEFEAMKRIHRQTEFTNADLAEVFNLTRKYVNPHQATCLSCRNNLRDAKNNLNTFYLFWKDEIEARLYSPIEEPEKAAESTETSLEEAKKQVKEYSTKKKPTRKKK